MLTVGRIDHLVLTCRDVAATVLLHRSARHERGHLGNGRVALALGRQKLNLHPAGQEADAAGGNVVAVAAHPMPGAVDICLVVGEPIAAVVAHLAASGVPVEEGPVVRTGALGAIRSVYVRDPDGNLVELARYVDDGD